MTRIFPDAKDYRTVTLDISREDLQAVESAIGFPLLPGQREQFQYFEMTGKTGAIIGYIIAGSQKGEYGAIEFVFGMDAAFTVNGIYIQRSRERDRSFKEQPFLDSFLGLKPQDTRQIGARFTGSPSLGTTAVIQGVVKELAVFDRLVLKNRP